MSPRTLTDFTVDQFRRRDIEWIKTVEVYLWRGRYVGPARVVSVFLSDATRYLPAATVVDPMLEEGLLSGDGEGWTTPAGWGSLNIVTNSGTGANELRASSLNTHGGNLEPIGTLEMFGAVPLNRWTGFSDTIRRHGGVVLCSQLDGTSYYGCIAEYGPSAGVSVTTIYRYAAGVRVNLVQVPTALAMWEGQRLYADTRQAAGGGLQITVRAGGPEGPIRAQVIDATPLTGTYAGPTIFVGTGGNTVQVRLGTPMVGVSRREYLGAVLKWGQMGDSIEATRPASASSSLDIEVSDALQIVAREIAPDAGTVHTYDRFSAMVNDAAQTDGWDIGVSGIFVRWVPRGGILGASNYLLSSPDTPADDVLLYAGLFDAWRATDLEVVTLQGTSPEGGGVYVRVDQAEVGPIAIGLVSPTDWRSGFEEGSLVEHVTADQSSVWTFAEHLGATSGGLAIVAGIHGASQYALRFEANGASFGTKLGGFVEKRMQTSLTSGTFNGKGIYAPVAQPTTRDSVDAMRIVEVSSTGGTPLKIYWLTNGKYRLENVGQATTVDSSGTMGTLDRLEWQVDIGVGVELRIFDADGRVARETLTLSGDPGGGNILGNKFYGYGGPTISGIYDLDDTGMSTHGWMGPGCQIIAKPNSNVTAQWTPSAGSNFQCVDDHPGSLNDADYVSAATAGLIDLYGWTIPRAAFVPSGASFYRATLFLRSANTGSPGSVLPFILDELGNQVTGLTYLSDGGASMINTQADEVTVYSAAARTLADVQQWQLGISLLSNVTIRLGVFYAQLEYV